MDALMVARHSHQTAPMANMSSSGIVSHGGEYEQSYFTYDGYSGWLVAHIILMMVAWFFILPISVMLSIARSRLALASHLALLAVNGVGLFVGVFYNANTPDLYENNAHHKLGWILTWLTAAYAFLSAVGAYSPAKGRQDLFPERFRHAEQFHSADHHYRYSRDSGQGTEPASPGTSSPPAMHSPTFYKEELGDEIQLEERRGLLGNNAVDRFFSRRLVLGATSKLLSAINTFCHVVDRTILILAFTALATGVVTYGGHFKGHEIFSGLAHFVKGGIFFWYGLLVLGRAMGSFADLGWSWNMKPPAGVVGRRKAKLPSAEFAESLLIFVYGSTNVFLEHLGSEDGAWSATDLEHASISVMFLGGGLCGMLIESGRVRDLLNATLLRGSGPQGLTANFEAWQPPRTYGYSLNPMPAIVIMLLGMLMSGHHQASMVSTMLHAQWGGLFAVAALARVVTYVLVYISPPASYLPSRPPSELVVAFCLISGGLLFMSSNSDFVAGLEKYDINAMVLFTIVMGFTSFTMAWELIVLAIKGWAVRRQSARGSTG